MAVSYSKKIQKLLSEQMSGDIASYSKDTLIKLNKIVQKYLKRVELWNTRAVSKFNQTIAFSDPEQMQNKQDLYSKRYAVIKKMIYERPDINYLLQEGYRILDILRETITGETIKYAIGVEYFRQLYEGYLTLDQILSISQAVPEWQGGLSSLVKLRLSKVNKATLIELLGNPPSISFKNDHSSLYASVKAYAKAAGLTNQGNIYEAYKQLVVNYKENTISPAEFKEKEEEFQAIYNEVRKNLTKFTQGGDILDEQVKFFGKSPPSLATIATIRGTLTQFSQAIASLNPNAIKTTLRELFYDDSRLDAVEDAADRYAEDTIDKIVEAAFNNKKT